MPPVRVMRSPQSVALLQSVLRTLGHVAAVELGPETKLVRQTLSIHNFCRYPLLATCPDATVLDAVNYPLFVLARSGMALNEPVESQALLHITSLSHQVITSVLLRLI